MTFLAASVALYAFLSNVPVSVIALAAAGRYRAYGFTGAVFLFLLWIYFGVAVMLPGASVNSVSSR